MKVFGHAPGKTPSFVVLHPLYSVPGKSVQCRRPRHFGGSVWRPAPSPALDHGGFRSQPGTARAGEGAGLHTEPAIWTLISGKLYFGFSDAHCNVVSNAGRGHSSRTGYRI